MNAGSSALICGLIGAGVGRGRRGDRPRLYVERDPQRGHRVRRRTGARRGRRVAHARPRRRRSGSWPAHEGDPAGAHAGRTRRHGRSDRARARARPRARRGRLPGRGATFAGQRLGTFGDAGAFSLQFNKIITTGEGGVMITDRDDLYELAIDVHDCAGSVRRGAGSPALPRLELPRLRASGRRRPRAAGAARRAARSACVRTRHRLAERVRELPGLTLRRPNDDGGDAGICLIAFAPTPALAAEAADALAPKASSNADLRPAVHRPSRLPLLGARARRHRRRRPPCARLPAHARPARSHDPRRRLPAPRRCRTSTRSLSRSRRSRRGCSRDCPRRCRRRRPRRPGRAPPVPGRAPRPLHGRRARRAEPRPSARRSARATGSPACTQTTARCSTQAALDAIVVCSPAGTHAEVVLAALDAGLHVFVEKPMCITLADADAIVAARDRAGQVVQVGTMKRYDPAVEAMLDELPDVGGRASATSASSSTTRSSSRIFEPGRDRARHRRARAS